MPIIVDNYRALTPDCVLNHDIRLQAVKKILIEAGADSVLDLGCGDGQLLSLLAIEPSISRLTGVDFDPLRIASANLRLKTLAEKSKIKLWSRPIETLPSRFKDHTAISLVEVIEHQDQSTLSQFEQLVFSVLAPELVVVTTPDASFRLPAEELTVRGHVFEWNQTEFDNWAANICRKYPYKYEIRQLDGPTFFRGTQIAIFQKN
jgi:cyclopropane fatty-acyl-phospholipid synthase-like methyltransferase